MADISKKILVATLVSGLFISSATCASEESATTQFRSRFSAKDMSESLIDSKLDTFARSHICVINTVSDPEGTHVKFFNPDLAEIVTFKCAKNPKQTDRGEWEKCKVLRKTKRVYSANVKLDDKYEGYRVSFLGILFEHMLGLNQKYTGKALIDEYKNYPLWNVVLEDREEVLDFLEYIKGNLLQHSGRSRFEYKPVLLLTLKDDPKLATLTAQDCEDLGELFEVVALDDYKTTKFFTDTELSMDSIIMKFDSGKPICSGEKFLKTMFRHSESLCSDFKLKDLSPKATLAIAGMLGIIFKDEIKGLLKKGFTKVKNFSTE